MIEDQEHWERDLKTGIESGFLSGGSLGTGIFEPRMVLNEGGRTVEHTIVEELKLCDRFIFSVAFVSSSAIAQLKQHLLDFEGTGRIVTSDFLNFNNPAAFAELLNLRSIRGIEVLRHEGKGFHPKGYVFENSRSVTAMIGSSNLTSRALSQNHEWNLKVSAANGSGLAAQLRRLHADQTGSAVPLTESWVQEYSTRFIAQFPESDRLLADQTNDALSEIVPNTMQQDALLALDFARAEGAKRAIIISATGTGKTMLSALDVRAVNPKRMLFIVHREQILDRTIFEYKKVLSGDSADYGKLTGSSKQQGRRYVFATVQTLSQESVLAEFDGDHFDYIIIDEAHRAGASTYQKVIGHFQPRFLLGMTATPERTDSFNVFELFDHNVPYEIRLNQALDAEMLCPFHYYGVSDFTYEDGTTTDDLTELVKLLAPGRIDHLLSALNLYAQAGNPPRGLIFCSRKAEAVALSTELNARTFRGKLLRTVALTGDDPIETREQKVSDLENGLLDYILTVDVFNEGVDIPSVNQVIMLRQTQSAIIFVQQLGRGLRLSEGKEHLVVIDFIGNYAQNFLIPIALFGDQSLNKESLRERLNETFEGGALPGLSSVSFDEISRERILDSIAQTRLDTLATLKNALVSMKYRTGSVPTLRDFYRFDSVDPVLLATKKEHYPALVQSALGVDSGLNADESMALSLLSKEVLAGKRLHEFLLLDLLLSRGSATLRAVAENFQNHGLASGEVEVRSAINTLALMGYTQAAARRYGRGIVIVEGGVVRLTETFLNSFNRGGAFSIAVADLLETGKNLTGDRYREDRPFTHGMQYSRHDAAHIVGWDRSVYSTIYGVKTDAELGVCLVFVTLEKSENVSESIAYQDALLDPATMRWFSVSNRKLESKDVAPMISGAVAIHVFAKKDDAEGVGHYYLGQASADDWVETTMPAKGRALPVVKMLLRFDEPISQGLFDYFSPTSRKSD